MNHRQSSISFWAVCLALFACLSLASGCEDPCDGKICENGGTCIDGECECPEGFIGPNCNINLDPCANKNCDPTGTENCVSGANGNAYCQCKDGYEGDFCELTWTRKFIRIWEATEDCMAAETFFDVQVEDGPEFKKFTIANFHNEANTNTTAKIVCRMISSNSFDIPEQIMPFGTVTGIGSFQASGTVGLNYTIIRGKDTLNCQATLAPN
ncbi:hypothetical protein [Pontibacter sp. G13]|uniref:hypothetical protein n=1 Tax=Pontibacter sp. G13 TaxID=3074898 RepID=UPI00288A7206|nr:hypothetical protein [Pontibacter sp. G13]WNJ21115.1 hypothetical protein RJD25_11655 [Pontibacter sp. G13]